MVEQKFGTTIKNAAETRSPIIAEIETGSYLQLFLYRAPKGTMKPQQRT
jgi:hypothetical protein